MLNTNSTQGLKCYYIHQVKKQTNKQAKKEITLLKSGPVKLHIGETVILLKANKQSNITNIICGLKRKNGQLSDFLWLMFLNASAFWLDGVCLGRVGLFFLCPRGFSPTAFTVVVHCHWVFFSEIKFQQSFHQYGYAC